MDPRLVEAAQRGDIAGLEGLLVDDSLLLERSSLGMCPDTALHVAAMTGQTEFVMKILKLKPELATRLNRDGFSPLHLASANGFEDTVKEILKASSGLVQVKSSDGRTPLHCAAINGQVKVIRELLCFCPDSKNDETLTGQTAFHLAVKNNQFQAFKAMIDMLKSPNLHELVNLQDHDGNTVLHLAAAKKQTLAVKLLLGRDDHVQQGSNSIAEVNARNKNGLTALDVLDVVDQMVGEPNDYKIRELLIRAGARRGHELDTPEPYKSNNAALALTLTASNHDNLWQFLLKELLFLNPLKLWKNLAMEVRKSPSHTQSALMVVAVLIATVTYQAILSPPGGVFHNDNNTFGANIAFSPQEFVLFMGPNSIGFFVSLAVIVLLIDGFPLKALLGVAVRSMAAAYVCGLFYIGPTSFSASMWGATVIGIIFLVDLVRFCLWLFERWSKEIRRKGFVCENGSGLVGIA